MVDIYTDVSLKPLFLAIRKMVKAKAESGGRSKEDIDYAISSLFEDVVFWELWEPEDGDSNPRSNNPLYKSILGVVGSVDRSRALYAHLVSWELWVWEQKREEDLEEAVFWAEQNAAIYGAAGVSVGSEYGAGGPFDGLDEELGFETPTPVVTSSVRNPEVLSLVELHLMGQHDQKSHGGGRGGSCGLLGCDHSDISSSELSRLRDGRENALRASGKDVKLLPAEVWTGGAPRLNKKATWKGELSASEREEIGRKHQGVAVQRISDGAFLDPNTADTSHAAYQIHQVGLEALLGDGDFIGHLVMETEPVTVESWGSSKGYVNSPMRTYALPNSNDFLLGIALRPDGSVATLVPLKPVSAGTLQRRDSRVMVDALVRKLGSKPGTKIVSLGRKK